MITTGTFKCKVDQKGRFYFPTELKKQLTLPVVEQGFVIRSCGFFKGLELYPKQSFDKLVEKHIAPLNDFNREDKEFQIAFFRNVKHVEIDGSGRILIPKLLINYAGIDEELIIQGVVDRYYIWAKSVYEKMEKTPEQTDEIGEKILGNKEKTKKE